MTDRPTLHIERQAEITQVQLQGDWTLAFYQDAKAALAEFDHAPDEVTVDASGLSRLDSSGAFLLHKKLGAKALDNDSFSAQQSKLIHLVTQACERKVPAAPKSAHGVTEVVAQVGVFCTNAWQQQKKLLGFTGQVLLEIIKVGVNPRRWRFTALTAQVEQIGLNAIPIVALLTFLVGAVVAFLGATVLAEFGAEIYTVNLVGFSFLREFGVLLAAILLAGRTASAFTAQLGSMKANEEVDALRAQGLNPIEVLVVPRVVAMVISLPALTILAMASGVAGGLMVCWLALDISPQLFLHIFTRDISITHFWVGLIKAPVFAIVIALIGCLEGFKVSGSAQSVGEHTTSAVVQSIFMVILLDALFALFFMEINW